MTTHNHQEDMECSLEDNFLNSAALPESVRC